MTVKELIAALEGMDPAAKAVVFDAELSQFREVSELDRTYISRQGFHVELIVEESPL